MRPVLVSLALFCIPTAWAETLFESNAVLDVTLTGPISTLLRNPERDDELEFVLNADGVEHDVEVKTRGNSRLEICEFPPMRLDFDRNAVDGTIFDGHNKLKLVTHCRNYDRGEQDLLEEYLAYRLFNVLSKASYRVRLMRMHYVDTDRQLDPDASPRYGFVLEPEQQLAARLGGTKANLGGVPKQRHDLGQAALLYLFQYMIGNTDWGLVRAEYDDNCCHNITLIDVENLVVTIPYDFDLAGLVNARYAHPDPELRIKSVRQRLYRGLCQDPALLRLAIDHVVREKSALLGAIREVPGLSEKNVTTAERYLNGFFKLANDPDKLLRRFESHCL